MSGLSISHGLSTIDLNPSDYHEKVWGPFLQGVRLRSIQEEVLQHVILLLSVVIQQSRIEPERAFARAIICAIIKSAADSEIYKVISTLLKDQGFIQKEMTLDKVVDFPALRKSIHNLCFRSKSEWENIFKARSLDVLKSFKDYFYAGKKWETSGSSSPMVLMLSSGEINQESTKMARFLLKKFPRDFLYMQIDEKLVPFWAYLTYQKTDVYNILYLIFKIIDPRILSVSLSIEDQNGHFFIEHEISDDFYNLSNRGKHESILPLLNRMFTEKSSMEITKIIQNLCDRNSPWADLIMQNEFDRFLGELIHVQETNPSQFLTCIESIIPFLSPDNISEVMMSLDDSIIDKFKNDPSSFYQWNAIYPYLNYIVHALIIGDSEVMVQTLFSLDPKVIAMIVPVLAEGLFLSLLPWIEIGDDFRAYCTVSQNEMINNYLVISNNAQPSEEEIGFA